MDARYERLRKGLEQLSDVELRRIIDYTEPMVYDDFNFDEESRRF